MIFADDDQMVETLSANRADGAFGVWILEGRSRRGDHSATISRPDEIFGTDTGALTKLALAPPQIPETRALRGEPDRLGEP